MWWTVHLEGGPRRVNHAAVAVGDRIFSFGGYCTGDNYRKKTPIDLFVLNPHTYRWREVPKPRTESAEAEDWPYQRYGHTVCAHGTDIFLFGGRNDEAPCNVVYKYDTQTGTWSRPEVFGQVPPERDGHSACIIRGCMYIFGGYEESHSRYGQEVFKLDLSTMVWSLVHCKGEQPQYQYRDFHSATAIGDRMYIYGGRSEMPGMYQHGQEIYSNKLSYLDTTSSTWFCPRISSPRPKGRRSHSAINHRGQLMIFGGYNGRLNEHMNDLWLLDPETWTWRQVQPHGHGPMPRRRQAMCLVGSKIYLFGGTSPYDGPPIQFTEEQEELLHETVDDQQRLIDHNDLYVLDLQPSLRTLCMIAVIKELARTEPEAAASTSQSKSSIRVLDVEDDDDELMEGAAASAEPKAEVRPRWDAPRLAQMLSELPAVVRTEMRHMTEGNTISAPLPLKLG